MPWTIADVERFNSGLTQSQKRQWVRIANSVLASCQAENGSNCEASAIRQANVAVNNNSMETNLRKHVQTNQGYTLRRETSEGIDYLVAPVVMMVEGVHSGSHGALLHQAEELGKYPASWNGIPVTVHHPNLNGQDVGANDPKILEQFAVGRVFNTYMTEDGKLRGEAWIQEDKISTLSPEALEYIENQRPLDVSVGVFTDEEQITGNYQGETYQAIARNHRPDHLALLPGGQGACSWADGCGIRNNEKGGINEMTNNELQKKFVKDIVIQQMGYREIGQTIQSKLDAMDTDSRMHFLEEVYDDYFVYRVSPQEGDSEFYQRSYSTNEEGTIELGTDPVQVRKNVEFVTMSGKSKRTKFNNNKQEGGTMSTEKKPCCPDKVNELIANNATKFTEDDKEWLLTQSAETIEKMFPVEPEGEPKAPENNAAPTKEQAIQVLKDTLKTPKEFMQVLPQEVAGQLQYGLKLHEDHRTKLAETIKNNTAEGTWSDDELKQMATSMLEKIANSVYKEEASGMADYSLFGGGNTKSQTNEPGTDGLMLPAGYGNKDEK